MSAVLDQVQTFVELGYFVQIWPTCVIAKDQRTGGVIRREINSDERRLLRSYMEARARVIEDERKALQEYLDAIGDPCSP